MVVGWRSWYEDGCPSCGWPGATVYAHGEPEGEILSEASCPACPEEFRGEGEDALRTVWGASESDDGPDGDAETGPDWSLVGTAHVGGLRGLPEFVLDIHETERYGVFRDGERLLLVPADEVEP